MTCPHLCRVLPSLATWGRANPERCPKFLEFKPNTSVYVCITRLVRCAGKYIAKDDYTTSGCDSRRGHSGGMKESYNPSPINIPKGTTVKRTNSDNTAHTGTEGNPSGSTPSVIRHSCAWNVTHTFAIAGTVQYYCNLHPFMLGKVVVKQFFTTIFLTPVILRVISLAC